MWVNCVLSKIQRGYVNPMFLLPLLLKHFGKLDRWLFYSPDRTPAHCLLHPSDALTRTPLEVKEPVDVGWPLSYHPPIPVQIQTHFPLLW